MSQFASNRKRTQSQPNSFLNSNFANSRVTRPMLLQACGDVEHELRGLLRRQRWIRLGKLLRRSLSF